MKPRYWITAICIVLTLVGQTICYAGIHKPEDGAEYILKTQFPIQFEWDPEPNDVYLKVWLEEKQDDPEINLPFKPGNNKHQVLNLPNGEYRWGITHTSERSPPETAKFTVDIPSGEKPEGEETGSTGGGTEGQGGAPESVTLPAPSLDFDPNENRLSVKWEPNKSKLLDQFYYYRVFWTDRNGQHTSHKQEITGNAIEKWDIPNIQLQDTYQVYVDAYNSKDVIIATSKVAVKNTTVTKPETESSTVEPTKKRTGWGLLRVLSLWILIIFGIIIALLAIRYGFFWLKEKLRQDTDDESYYWGQHKHKERLTTSSNDVENQMIMKLARSMRRIQEEFQDMQRMVKTSTASNKVDLRLLTDEIREVRERIKGGTEDYVSASQFKSETETLETLLSESTEQLRKDLYREMGQLNEKIASLENDLITLRKERLAEKNAAVVAARKELDILIEQVASALPQDAANLLNALSFASHADELPHLGEVGQRLLSEICSSKGSASLCSYIETMDKLQEICEKLDHLLTRTLPDAEQRSSRLLGEAQEILTAYTKTKGSKSFDSELIERTRRALLKEIGMLYISIVMGRFRGDGAKAYSQLAETLQQLGLDLINITIGQTRPDERLHDVQSAMPTDKYPSGTVANVVKMGYTERATGDISKAQVIVSQ